MSNKWTLPLLDFYYRTCSQDESCQQLRAVLLRMFRCRPTNIESDQTNQMDQVNQVDGTDSECGLFELVHSLVLGVCGRLGVGAVWSVWLHCCSEVVSRWASQTPSLARQGTSLLPYLLRCWTRFEATLNLGHSLTVYVHSAPTAHYRQMFCDLFAHHFFEHDNRHRLVFDHIVAAIEHRKDSATLFTVRSVLKLLWVLDQHDRTVFYRYFALPYLQRLSQVSVSTDQCIVFSPEQVVQTLKTAESVIDQHIEQAKLYYFPLPLMRMVGRLLYLQLICAQRELMCQFSTFVRLVQCDLSNGDCQIDQLQYVFAMISYDKESVHLMAINVERHLQAELKLNGLKELCSPERIFQFVLQLTKLHHHWSQYMLVRVFSSHPSINQSVTKAFTQYINTEPINVCILSVFVHLVSLNQTLLESNDPKVVLPNFDHETVFRQACSLLSLVEDKETLADYVRFFLCDRIVRKTSYDAASDFIRIGKLINSLGVESPINVNLMVKEFKSSLLDLELHKVRLRVESFQVRCLNGAFWKLDTDPITQTFRLPKSFWSMFNSFRVHFSEKNAKKSLCLNRNYGTAVVWAHFHQCPVSYHFVTSLRQSVILITFNRHSSVTFAQLKSITKIDHQSLKQCLQVFLKYRLIKTDKAPDFDETNMEEHLNTAVLSINDSFGHEIIDSAKVTSTNTVEIDWVTLQLKYGLEFDLHRLMHTNTVSREVRDTNGIVGASNVKVMSKAKVVEYNHCEQSVRVEAAVVRVLKRAKVVTDLKTLHTLTMQALARTNWTVRLSPNSRHLATDLSIDALDKAVRLLEKNGYLKCLPTGEIVYEP